MNRGVTHVQPASICSCMCAQVCVCAFGCCFVGANGCIPLTMLVDICQCCCLLMFGCVLLSRHFPCCKTFWIKNLNLNSHRNAGKNFTLWKKKKKKKKEKERKKGRTNEGKKRIFILNNISTIFCVCVCVCLCVCVCVCVCACSAFLFVCIIPYVNCFGRTMLYMCIEYHI